MLAMTLAMVCAGLLMYLTATVFFTFGLTKYPRSFSGFLIGTIPACGIEAVMIGRCAAMHRDWVDPVSDSIVIAAVGAGIYLYKNRLFKL